MRSEKERPGRRGQCRHVAAERRGVALVVAAAEVGRWVVELLDLLDRLGILM